MLEPLSALGAVILGSIVGSFLNVLVFRYGSGFSINGRSRCFSCARTLSWFEMAPIASFIALRGRCRSCRAKISLQYPLVEVLTALVFLLIYRTVPESLPSFFFYAAVWSIVIVLVVYDVRHTIIPDGLVYSFIGLTALQFLYELAGELSVFMIISALFPAALLFILFFFSGGRAMGFGDVKFALGIGFLLPASLGLSAVIIAFWSGAAFAGVLFLTRSLLPRRHIAGSTLLSTLSLKSEVPFAPFLALGALLVFVTQFNLFPPETIISIFSAFD